LDLFINMEYRILGAWRMEIADQEDADSFVMRDVIICNFHQILLMSHACGR